MRGRTLECVDVFRRELSVVSIVVKFMNENSVAMFIARVESFREAYVEVFRRKSLKKHHFLQNFQKTQQKTF